MVKILILVFVIFAVVMIVGGTLLIAGAWKPFRDETGAPVPMSKKEKWGLGAVVASLIIGAAALVLHSDHKWVKKLRGES